MNAGPTQLYRTIAADVLCDVALALDSPVFAGAMDTLRTAVSDMAVAADGPEADAYQARLHTALDVVALLLAGSEVEV